MPTQKGPDISLRDLAVQTSTILADHILECGRNYDRLTKSIEDFTRRAEDANRERRQMTNRILYAVGVTFLGTIWNALRQHGIL